MTLIDFYERDIKSRPAIERLKLASLILNDIANPAADQSEIDASSEWGESDYEEFGASTWQHIESQSRAESHGG